MRRQLASATPSVYSLRTTWGEPVQYLCVDRGGPRELVSTTPVSPQGENAVSHVSQRFPHIHSPYYYYFFEV
jgi:hypothetical protein